MDKVIIPFNKPYMTGMELEYISQAHKNGSLAGDGPFTKRCHNWLENNFDFKKALLTHSCTAALEMSAILLDIKRGDEIIMPSYTFVSTANAFVSRGATPIFVDIRRDTLNIDEHLIESAITPKTKAIVVVHYAGVACEMDTITDLSNKYGIPIVEDAAQGIMSEYKGRALGSIGQLGTYSFHETKNVISGEGGALLVNDPVYSYRSEVIREKGTDRTQFFRGNVDKYTWQDIGSSFLPGELVAAFLWAQFEEAERITKSRLDLWNYYHKSLKEAEDSGALKRPFVPRECKHNAHMYYLILPNKELRDGLISELLKHDIHSVFHYIPLHSSPAGEKFGKYYQQLPVTDSISETLIRLPLWVGLTYETQDRIVSIINSFLEECK